MTHVSFYSLTDADDVGHSLSCSLACEAYSKKQRVNVWCADKEQAEAIDELLWQLPTDRFIPHNLVGEGPKGGTPVQVCWQPEQLRPNGTVIVLSNATISNPNGFQHIIDFVPAAEAEKALARERYKYYQRAGCTMRFTQADS